MRAGLRARPARPRSTSAFIVSATRTSLLDAPGTSRDTTAAAAPRDRASATKRVAVGGLAGQREEEIALGRRRGCRRSRRWPRTAPASLRATARAPPRRRSRARSCAASCQLARHLGVVERMGDALDGLARSRGPCRRSAAGRRPTFSAAMPSSIAARRSVAHLRPVLPARRNAAHDLGADRRRLLAARIVVGDQRACRRGAWRSRPSPAAWRGRGRRRSRTPRSACPWRRAAGSPAPSPAPRACGRNRHRPGRRSCGAPRAAAGPARRSMSPAPRRTRATSPPVATTRPSAASALEAWKPPTSGSSTSCRVPRTSIDEMLAGGGRRRRAAAGTPCLWRRRSRSGCRGARQISASAAARSLSALTTAVPPAGSSVLEQPRLGGEIGVHRGVIVEMLVREIGEGRRRELQAVETMLVEAVARRLDGEMRHALARQRREIGMELHRIGRGEAGVAREARRDDAQRADAGGLEPERRPDMAHEMHGRGLAVGAGDRGDGRGLQPGEGRRHQRDAPARIGVAHHDDAGIERRQGRVGRGEDGRPRRASAASATKLAPSAFEPARAAKR